MDYGQPLQGLLYSASYTYFDCAYVESNENATSEIFSGNLNLVYFRSNQHDR
ncbi:protein of unknown function [Pseudoalteromonas carrageenovora IAM 12662]|uniref:Uncharacterized protein n=1 Tax=Pseudoalteromonas carrageenovora IAM 12662 TaxID=1314868 RepID=A0A2K4X8T4_PSEVC|nr:protein of unknown function [Pseudoalteromonas carrageenovora IAM 12662]